MKDLIGLDGVLGEYPETQEVEDPPEDATPIAVKKWESAVRKSDKQNKLLDEEYGKLYGSNV